MLNDFKKIISLFSREERSKGYKLLVLVSIMALIEVFTIASIFPFIYSLITPDKLIENKVIVNLVWNDIEESSPDVSK